MENTTWVEAKDLHPGDVALGANGQELVVTDITIDERAETVYNFEVDEYHTYFVGEVGVWVHNADYLEKIKNFVNKGEYESDEILRLNELQKERKERREKALAIRKKIDIQENGFFSLNMMSKFSEFSFESFDKNAPQIFKKLDKAFGYELENGVMSSPKGELEEFGQYIDKNGHEHINTKNMDKPLTYYLDNGSILTIKPGVEDIVLVQRKR
ncbi:polymorphic toxin-type HINT domain-containing protein [Leptospira kemamanensis]|uniref:polymorphic toxin-type HINT domain-containing protein n=1 Tax=Leptospira kemamanensis TaxID=2484942 RepID=UPI00244A9616|nr:polymorphic toxin-type HINT domain-containing protein [Leptospira kemamanensis]